MSLSKRASCYTHDQDSAYFLGWHEYEKNPFHEVNDLQGVIQMGLAENQLCFDLFESWLAKNPDAAGLKRDGISIFRDIAMLQHYHGLPAFKQALAEFMSEIRGNNVSFDPSHIVFTAGRATSADETLLFCLAGPGEAFLVPTPYNPRFNRDLKWRTGIEIVPVRCTSSNGFQITEAALNQAYEEAENRNLRVKGVLVMNPSNPLGTTMTSTELNLLVNFVEAKGIHLISDETYAGTVFSTPSFQSITQILQNRNNVEFSEVYKRIHVVYCLSKDLGLPGLGVGAIYSKDEKIVATAMKMSRFGSVSSQTQYLLSAVLSDTKFTSKFISANQKRLKKRHEMMVSELHEAGVNCLQSNAGLFCWVDMRHLLRSDTFEAEMELWKEIIYDVKLNISPGSSCHCSEPGWFRVCFANMSEEILVLAMERFKSFVTETKGSNT